MKRNWGLLWFFLVIFILSTLSIFLIESGLWKPTNPSALENFFKIVMVIFALLTVWKLKRVFQTQKNYHWREIKEGIYFKIVEIPEEFLNPIPDVTPSMSEIQIEVPDIGKVSVLFPTLSGQWGCTKPKEKQEWKRLGDEFFRKYPPLSPL